MSEIPDNDTKQILVVEDDREIAGLVSLHLQDMGFGVDCVEDGKAALEKYGENEYALIVLDIMLPGVDGFGVCKRIRSEDKSIPILMLTAKAEEIDKVVGLELGADDYLTKPFSIRELIARVKAIFRRIEADRESANEPVEEEIRFKGLVIYPARRKVMLGEETVDLTAKEFDLLLLFARNPGRAYSRQNLLNLVWGYQYNGYSHTVNSHINRLRSKIEQDPSSPRYIRTMWGTGYRFAESHEL